MRIFLNMLIINKKSRIPDLPLGFRELMEFNFILYSIELSQKLVSYSCN